MRRRRKARREPTITLINIVFLLLVFFLVAGTLAPAPDRDVELVDTSTLPAEVPPDALLLHPDGRLSYRGDDISSAGAFLATAPPDILQRTRVVPDRSVPALDMIQLAHDLVAAGSTQVVIVTRRGAP